MCGRTEGAAKAATLEDLVPGASAVFRLRLIVLLGNTLGTTKDTVSSIAGCCHCAGLGVGLCAVRVLLAGSLAPKRTVENVLF